MNELGALSSRPHKLQLSLDLRVVVMVLLVVIGAMLLIWKPWSGSAPANARSIKVTGEVTLSAEPDEFVFYPSYQFKNADRAAALAEMSKKSDEVIAKLKGLGVPDSKIKSNANGAQDGLYYQLRGSDDTTYNLQLTITVNSRDQAQKVQDYLTTTNPTGMVTPNASFSEAKRKELENQGRNKATQDARSKAEQSAKNLDTKLGKVKTVTDGAGFGDVMPLYQKGVALDSSSGFSNLSVQPGQNDLNYSVTVEFFLK